MKTTCNFCSEELTGPSHNCAGLNKIVFHEGHEPTEPTEETAEPVKEEAAAPEETVTPARETTEQSPKPKKKKKGN